MSRQVFMSDLPELMAHSTIPSELAGVLGSGHDKVDNKFVLSIQNPVLPDIPPMHDKKIDLIEISRKIESESPFAPD